MGLNDKIADHPTRDVLIQVGINAYRAEMAYNFASFNGIY